ncbi:hypothetical protein GARC_4819 [Paraglaciecola arctica BSs20135]|uniref:Uncharacterized protein n=1 Tax=Paraglaciecola arctica BSs20135 TaxID=493475 RepID=K6YCT8_9ALTE|nr:hypothetical protein GARC_4819 [Paraglaciecola arctica BSs20135]
MGYRQISLIDDDICHLGIYDKLSKKTCHTFLTHSALAM